MSEDRFKTQMDVCGYGFTTSILTDQETGHQYLVITGREPFNQGLAVVQIEASVKKPAITE